MQDSYEITFHLGVCFLRLVKSWHATHKKKTLIFLACLFSVFYADFSKCKYLLEKLVLSQWLTCFFISFFGEIHLEL